MDPDLFFPDDRSVADAAVRVCESCPVVGECGEYADHERICGYPVVGVCGVAGGVGPKNLMDNGMRA